MCNPNLTLLYDEKHTYIINLNKNNINNSYIKTRTTTYNDLCHLLSTLIIFTKNVVKIFTQY